MTVERFEGNEFDAVGFDAAGEMVETLRSGEEPPLLMEFRRFFDGLANQPEHFHADEFMVMGPSNGNSGSACFQKNSLPPQSLWDNIVPLISAMDDIRKELGFQVRITNCYRASAYNTCVGGVSSSQHLQFKAVDFVGQSGESGDWANAAKACRDNGSFNGGVGIYSGFVHVDVRGHPLNWDKR